MKNNKKNVETMKTIETIIAELKDSVSDKNAAFATLNRRTILLRFDVPSWDVNTVKLHMNCEQVRFVGGENDYFDPCLLTFKYDHDYIQLENWTVRNGQLWAQFKYAAPERFKYGMVKPLDPATFNVMYLGR